MGRESVAETARLLARERARQFVPVVAINDVESDESD